VASRSQPWAPPGSFMRAMREIHPERATRFSAMSARRAAEQQAQLVEPDEAPAPQTRRTKLPPREGFDQERLAVAAIERALKARGWGFERQTTAAGKLASGQFAQLGQPGRPDIYVYPGRGLVVFLEVKSRTGRTSEVQDRWHARARARGYVVEVVRTPAEALAAVERALNGRAEA